MTVIEIESIKISLKISLQVSAYVTFCFPVFAEFFPLLFVRERRSSR